MTAQGLREISRISKILLEPPHDVTYRPRRQPVLLRPRGDFEQTFTEWEVMFLCSIVNSTRMIQGRLCRTYWCTCAEMITQFGDGLLKQLKSRHAIEEWNHHEGFPAVTLTPWGASVLGFRLAEYWVRHIERMKEYRGVGRRLARIRVQRWDTEAYWTYFDRPERSLHIPGNTCELPLIGDPEDKRCGNGEQEYLEDWQTFSFTKNPHKAITITIRVGSFAHKIIIQRDKRACSQPRSSKKKKHGQNH